MRLFKNRGNIYFSKMDKEKSAEQRFLLIALVVIVIVTIIFVIVVGEKNDFSVKEFFKTENISATAVTKEDSDDVILPEVSGKSNYVILVSDDGVLLFSCVIQVDMDNVSYKASSFKADTVCDGEELSSVFASSGEANATVALESLLNVDIDYYISLESGDFASIYEQFGQINYPIISEIKYKNTEDEVPYSVKLNEGEQTLKGTQLVGLMRYYLDEKDNTSIANDIMLNVLSQQINENNYENREELFSLVAETAQTNITVRDYSASLDALLVLSSASTGANVYNASAEYDGDNITADSLKEVRTYFVKE
ncbi:MAG: LCP family protein [Clostridiales bacterium]|nr:LCP family protein [Clostridiales bacterium]